MREIKLTQNKIALIDEKDFHKISKYKWCASKAGNIYYAKTWINIVNKTTTITMHRLLTDCPKGMEVDHINGNGLDNRRSNIRICNRFQNARNCVMKSFNTSGYKGVYFHKQNKRWCAEITYNLKKISLGCYGNKIDAAKAYDKKAKELHGKFAKLNIYDFSLYYSVK